MDKITILGSGSTNLVPGKNAASVLIQRSGKNIVYDFGRGTATQLASLGFKQNDIEIIILSHYHPDHVSDLIPFLHSASWSQIDKRSSNLTIYGQPSIKEFIDVFFSPFDERQLSRGFKTSLVDLNAGKTTIQDIGFTFTDLRHSYGISFNKDGKNYAIMGDSDYHEDLVSSLSHVDIGVFDAGHLTDEEIVKLAVQTQAKKLVCSHQYRVLDADVLNKRASEEGFDGILIVANDLTEFTI